MDGYTYSVCAVGIVFLVESLLVPPLMAPRRRRRRPVPVPGYRPAYRPVEAPNHPKTAADVW